QFRLVVKTALKLLVVFVEYTESNAPLFIKAVNTTDRKSGVKPWSNILAILDEKDGIDTELLVFAMTLLNKTLAVLPDQDTFYDVTDCLEEQGMEAIAQRHLAKRGGDRDLAEQFDIYEVALRLEDGDTESGAATPASCRKERRGHTAGTGGGEKRGLERRRSRRHNSAGRGRSPTSPVAPSALPAVPRCEERDGRSLRKRSIEGRDEEEPITEPDTDDECGAGAEPTNTNDCCFEADAKSSPGSALTKSLPLVQNASSCMPAPVQRLSMTPSPLPPSSTPSSPSPPPAAALPAPAATLRSRAATPARHAANVSPAALPVRLPYVPKSPFHLFSYEPMDKPASLRERQDEAAAAATAAGTPVAARYSAGVNYNGNVYGTPGARSYGSPSSPASQAAGSQYSQNHSSEAADGKNSNKAMDSARAAAGLLSSSYKQHQESLAAERERRRRERDERLQRIEREERNKYNSREYMEERERLRREKEERYWNRYLERIAAEEREKELRNRTKVRMELNLTLQSPSTNASPVTLVSQPPGTPSACPSPTPVRPATPAGIPAPPPAARVPSTPSSSLRLADAGETPEEAAEETAEEPFVSSVVAAAEEVAPLSAKERENEAVNEKENCSASSSSSASSTLERDRAEEEPGRDSVSLLREAEIGQRGSPPLCCSVINARAFTLDYIFFHLNKNQANEVVGPLRVPSSRVRSTAAANLERHVAAAGVQNQNIDLEIAAARDATAVSPDKPSGPRAFAERFGRVTSSEQDEEGEKEMPPVAPPPPRKESDQLWEQMLAKTHELRIKDMDFTDLNEEDDVDMLDFDNLLLRSGDFVSLPPPPPVFPSMASVLFSPPPPPGCPPTMPPPSSALTGLILPPPPLFASPAHQAREGTPGGPGSPALAHSLKKKKTVRLFWSEVRHTEWQHRNHRYGKSSLWASLDPVEVDTNKLEILFESKSKELPVTKRSTTDGKRQELIVLDSKRSNAINIGLTVLPPPRTIKTAILNFDEYALNKEGIEKLLTMIPTEEEKQKITEAQLVNPDVPLGSAEQFLLTLSSISELSARLQLWAFKLDYETMEKEVAEPLQDIKEGMDQVEKNRTLRCILTTLLAVGNFLNGTNAKGFELHYLEKVPEVKDTVHKQSLLHHVCNMVVEKFPDTTDLYSEIGAITRSAKVDFDQVQENLNQMERRCRACWDHLKAIAKHETKPVLKTKMSEFLRDCAERIIILKIVHRRIVNRFHAFMLYIGHAPYSIRDVSITRFCRIVSEFALEYRTARERVLQQRLKRATHRERNKTRGKMITDTDDEEAAESGKFSGGSAQSPLAASASVPAVRRQLAAEDDAEHENMKAVLRTSVHASGGLHSSVPGTRTRARARASRGRVSTGSAPVFDDSPNATDDATDEIMDRIVKSATQAPCQRAATRERRRSRANRKSLRRTLKSGLTPEEAQALGLLGTAEMQV
uniref:Formin homology 2 domain containing 3b n=1 Tax=Petromyzon marinus TaxID=7757 RepID=S4RN63_PETMA